MKGKHKGGKAKHHMPKHGEHSEGRKHKEDGKHKMPKKVHGKMAMESLAHKKRGGKVSTPSSPLSGAAPKGFSGDHSEGGGTDKEND